MERETRNGIRSYSQFCVDDCDGDAPDTDTCPSPVSSSTCSSFIQHRVSKLDTLAGVAIKYGVEVADIKKMNGLVTDLQMFALKSLQIPLPGRHPPSPCFSNGSYTPGESSSEITPPRRVNQDLLGSFQSLKLNSSEKKVSPAMNSLQGYYGLKPADQKVKAEGFDMGVYRNAAAHYQEDRLVPKPSPYNPPLRHDRKSRSVANGFLDENGELADMSAAEREVESDKWNEKLVRRRQKSEADFNSRSPKDMMKEENSGNGIFSTIFGKHVVPRLKSAFRTATTFDAEPGDLNPIPLGLGDSLLADGPTSVRKSSSTPSFQDQESSSSSIWSTSKWSLKSDLQALSTATISKPFFDGLSNPITGRRNKTALD